MKPTDSELEKQFEDMMIDVNKDSEHSYLVDEYISQIKVVIKQDDLNNEQLEAAYEAFTKNKSVMEAVDAVNLCWVDKKLININQDWVVMDIELKAELFIKKIMVFDSAHDIDHIRRVVKNGIDLARIENGNLNVIIPACWLHDCVNVPKMSKDRALGSKLSADRAIEFLKEINYPEKYFEDIHHAIHAHSFSANVETKTLSARIVQDADRLDALGALGISRCLMYSAGVNRPLYDSDDPFAENRELDDNNCAIDHFFVKLETLPKTMKTDAGKDVAVKRWGFMSEYIYQLKEEITRVDI